MKEIQTTPPRATQIAKELNTHGTTRTDHYYWMNERENPKVTEYLEAENAYTKEMMAHTEDFQESLYTEMLGRIKKTDQSVPFKRNDYYYYNRTEDEAEYPLYCRKAGSLEAEEEILLNVPLLADGYDYYSIGDYNVAPNNKILAYSVDTVSRREYTIYFKDLTTGEVLKDEIPKTAGGITWANDNQTVFYTLKHEDTLLPYKVYRHKLGTPIAEDVLVYEEKDNTFYTGCFKTKSSKYLVIASTSTLTSEYRYIDANKPESDFKVFAERTRGVEYGFIHFGDYFYIRTNWNAHNFCLMRTPVNKTERENWELVIKPREEVLLKDVEVLKDALVVTERKEGLNHIRIFPWDGSADYYVHFEEEVYDTWLSVNLDPESEELRYGYTSLTTPSSTFDFNLRTKQTTLLKQQEIQGDFDKDNYISQRLWAKADDGVLVPISIIYKKSTQLDGTAPLWITGYGSYGYSSDVYFSSVRLSLLDRGFVYAIAHVRGGQEMGRSWYEDGKLLKKKNTFTDFNSCTRFLVDEKIASPEKVFANGGSAGGLLMGVIANTQPELYTGIIANVPFVDVVTTMLDESIPLTTGEFDEWGNPKDKIYYDYMLSYSPYDNVSAQNYPSMLVTTGLHDSQVQYWEPAKWVAKLRELKTDKNPLLFKIEMEFGHGGASGRFERLKEIAFEYAFACDLIGIED